MSVPETTQELMTIEVDALTYFSMDGDTHLARVISCYDGDTIHCVFKLFYKYYKFKIRLYGIDTPEMKPNLAIENRKTLVDRAHKAKLRLEELILNKLVYVYCREYDKYGRILAVIKLREDDDKTVNDMMIDEGYAVPYFGGTK